MAEDPQTPEYTMGYSEEFLRMLHRRSAQSHAAYLLPHLGPGMRLLDFGCGPGTISVGLAKAIEPGELHGDRPRRVADTHGACCCRGGGTRQRDVPRRRRHGAAVRGRLVRRRPLPRGADARSGHAGGPGRSETGAEARRHDCRPRDDRYGIVHGARLRKQRGMGCVRAAHRRQRRTPPDGEGASRRPVGGRVHGCPCRRILRFLRHPGGRRLLPRRRHGLVLLGRGDWSSDEVRAGDPGAIRGLARCHGPVAGPSWVGWRHRLRRGHRLQP